MHSFMSDRTQLTDTFPISNQEEVGIYLPVSYASCIGFRKKGIFKRCWFFFEPLFFDNQIHLFIFSIFFPKMVQILYQLFARQFDTSKTMQYTCIKCYTYFSFFFSLFLSGKVGIGEACAIFTTRLGLLDQVTQNFISKT